MQSYNMHARHSARLQVLTGACQDEQRIHFDALVADIDPPVSPLRPVSSARMKDLLGLWPCKTRAHLA